MNKQSLAVFTLLCVTCASGPAFAENRIGKVWHSRSAAYKLVHHNYETWLKPRIATAVQSAPGKELKERYLGLVEGPLKAFAAPAHSAMSNLTAVPNVTGMPSMSMNWGIRSQQQLYAQGQQNVAGIFNECIQQSSTLHAKGIDPGNCGATLESAQAAIANMNTAAQSYITHTQRNLSINQQVGGDDYTHRVTGDARSRPTQADSCTGRAPTETTTLLLNTNHRRADPSRWCQRRGCSPRLVG